MEDIITAEKSCVASIGCGVIGYSWALAFARAGYTVYAYNTGKAGQDRAKKNLDDSLKILVKNGAVSDRDYDGILSRVIFTTDIREAVGNAHFIQESTSETYEMKKKIIGQIEQWADKDAVIATSTSGLRLTQMRQGSVHPERIVVGHPYNPPHLIPLVEVYADNVTDRSVVDKTMAFYRDIGNIPILLKKEAPGFICNRLQIALYREICGLVMNGVCSVEDADKAVTYGPGLRWGIMGPSLVFELGGGEDGVAGLMMALESSINMWLDDMADFKHFPKEWYEMAADGVKKELVNRKEAQGNTRASLEEYRDKMLIETRKLHGFD